MIQLYKYNAITLVHTHSMTWESATDSNSQPHAGWSSVTNLLHQCGSAQ